DGAHRHPRARLLRRLSCCFAHDAPAHDKPERDANCGTSANAACSCSPSNPSAKDELMLPRYTSDYRTLLWALLFFPLVPALGYAWPRALPWLLPVALYTSYCSGVLTHNHVHVPVFRSRRANSLSAAWLSIFYGCPIATWIPTHLENHHRFVDGPEDVTRTSRRSAKHSAWQALVYTASCAHWQRPLIASY